MDSVNPIEYKLRHLGTRSVTLFPSRAQIQRDIKNVTLQPGTNQITILGFSPTVDKDSVKVEGNAAFTISDVSVEELPNREVFEDVFPEADSDDSSDEEDDDLDERRWKEHLELQRAKLKLTTLEDSRLLANEKVASAESRLKLLDAYGKTLDRKRGVVIEESLETYKQQRSKAYEDYMVGLSEQRHIRNVIENQMDEVHRLQIVDDKERDKAEKKKEKIQKAKERDRYKKNRRREEQRKEKQRIRKELEKFWPKFCYAVKIALETNTATPSSSRRTSVSSETRGVRPNIATDETRAVDTPETGSANFTCDLVLSYVTSSAYWAPSYDLQLSTTNATGKLSFDAELHNATSETWQNCKVVLSTSQATFAGLDDAIPTLNPWYLSLAQHAPSSGPGRSHERIAQSSDEIMNIKTFLARQKQAGPQRPRSEMFGMPSEFGSVSAFEPAQRPAAARKLKAMNATPFSGPFGNSEPVPPPPVPAPAGASAPPGQGLFGFGNNSAVQQSSVGYGAMTMARSGGLSANAGAGESFAGFGLRRDVEKGGDDTDQDGDDEDQDGDDEFEVSDSAMEETGLTTTYELPGLKTLSPKSTATKQLVANLYFTNVAYSHTVVAKYKPVAYLKAKIKNSSKMTLFKGRAGLTLDGSFMGRTSLPRCSAGETFTLSLGIDPAIRVTYPKPVIQRATSGLFSKENTAVFTRSVTLYNTRASAAKPISLVVQDQVPVSQDERLKVEVLHPQGMSLGGGEVKAGAPGLEASEHKEWGSARASLNKDGRVDWRVSLNPGKAVRLSLEYGVAFPMGSYPF